jgi:outer membrane lipoprotein-sorting protein
VAGLPEVIALLHRADWTRLSLSATVNVQSDPDLLLSRMRARLPVTTRGTLARMRASQSDRAALLIGLDGRYRLEHEGEDGLVQGNDGQGRWLWWRSGPSGPGPFEARLSGERPVPVLFCPQDLLDRHVLEVLGPVTASGRDAIAITATPRAGGQLYDRVEAAVDAELGIVLRREERFEGQLLTLTELTDVTMNPPEAADPARYTGPPGSRHPEEPGEASSGSNETVKYVVDLAAGGLGALIKHAPRRPGQRTDPEHAEAAMPSPDPEALAADDGSAPDDLLYLLYRGGEPHDLAATMHEWRDTAVMNAQFAQTIREAGVGGGVGSLLDAIPTGTTRTDARLRISAPDRYRVDYTRPDDGNAPRTVACDGEHRWHFYKDRILTAPGGPLRETVAYLVDPSWLLRRHLSAPRDITYRGRPAHQFRVTRGTGGLGDTGPLMFFPADAIVDAETGCLLRLISFGGDATAAWWELDDISTEPGDPDDFRVTIPPGAHVVEATGNPFADYAAVMPGLAGTAARTATDAVRRTHSAVSAARGFLDDLRGGHR